MYPFTSEEWKTKHITEPYPFYSMVYWLVVKLKRIKEGKKEGKEQWKVSRSLVIIPYRWNTYHVTVRYPYIINLSVLNLVFFFFSFVLLKLPHETLPYSRRYYTRDQSSSFCIIKILWQPLITGKELQIFILFSQSKKTKKYRILCS